MHPLPPLHRADTTPPPPTPPQRPRPQASAKGGHTGSGEERRQQAQVSPRHAGGRTSEHHCTGGRPLRAQAGLLYGEVFESGLHPPAAPRAGGAELCGGFGQPPCDRDRSKCCTSPHGAAVRHRPCQNTRWAASEHGERGNPARGGFAAGVLRASRWVLSGSHPLTRACGAGRARRHSHARRCPSTPTQPFPGLSVQQLSPHQPRKEVAPPTGGGLPCAAVASHTYATADSFTRGWACSHTCDHPLRERVSELIFYSSASWKVVANPPQWLKSHCNTGENTGRGCPLAGHTPAPVRAHHRLHAADDGAPHPADWREIETARCTERGAVHWALYTAAWDRRVAGARVLWRGALGATRSRMGPPQCGQ